MRLTAGALLCLALLAAVSCENSLLAKVQDTRDKAESPVITVRLVNEAALSAESPIDFGQVSLDTPQDIVFEIGNTGVTDLTLPANSIQITGTGANAWGLAENPAATVPPQGTTRFKLRFVPHTLGDMTARLVIASNDRATPEFPIQLKGSGIAQTAPVAVEGGLFQSHSSGSCEVMLSCATADSTIYYTTDSSSPDPDNPGASTKLYTAKFFISFLTADCTVKAIARSAGRTDSRMVSAVFTKNALQAPTIVPFISYNGQYYPTDTPLRFAISSASSNALILFSVDGTDPQANVGATNINATPFTTDPSGIHVLGNGDAFTYAGTHSGAQFTLKASAYATQAMPSGTISASYSFKAGTPAFASSNPPSAVYYASLAQLVLACPGMAGFTISYTTDGTDPTGTSATSTVASDGTAVLTMPEPAAGSSEVYTVKALASKTDWLSSAILSGSFAVCGAGVWGDSGNNQSTWDQTTWQ